MDIIISIISILIFQYLYKIRKRAVFLFPVYIDIFVNIFRHLDIDKMHRKPEFKSIVKDFFFSRLHLFHNVHQINTSNVLIPDNMTSQVQKYCRFEINIHRFSISIICWSITIWHIERGLKVDRPKKKHLFDKYIIEKRKIIGNSLESTI